MVLLERHRLVCRVALRLVSGAQRAWFSHRRVLPVPVGCWCGDGHGRRRNHAGEQSSHPASSRRTFTLGHDLWRIRRLVFSAAVPDAGLFFAAPDPGASQPDLGGHYGRHHLCDRASAQPDSHPDNADLGPGRLLRLSTIPQYLCARLGACHLRHLRGHHHPWACGAQHACRSWLSTLSGAAECSPEPKRPQGVDGRVGDG